MAAEKTKTWASVRAALSKTMELALVTSYTVESPFEQAKAVERRRAGRLPQTEEQRNVTLVVELSASWRRKGVAQNIRITSTKGATALENLDMLQRAFETIRLTAMRDLDGIVYRVYRQMYPKAEQQSSQQQQTPPPREAPRVSSAGPYAVLHIANDAPLEVAEAAYRALVKRIHPDVAGNGGHAQMVALNAAIEQIRQRTQRARQT